MRYAHLFGFYSIDAMPNQPSIAWCSDFTVFREFRCRGRGIELKASQNKMLSDLGFTCAMCSIKESNNAQRSILIKAGWVPQAKIRDIRTLEAIEIWIYHIDQGL